MKTFLLALFLLFPISAFACENTAETGEPFALAIDGVKICRSGYQLFYRPATRTPVWVAEHIERQEVTGKSEREGQFRQDPSVPQDNQATLDDYVGSGYARGHMAPAGNFRSDDREVRESFFLTNVIPQVQKCNNSGVWRTIEKVTRDWAIYYGELYVVTGPIYTNNIIEFIGTGVRVPSGMYKVVYNPGRNEVISFVVPNTELCGAKPKQFVKTLKEVEELTQTVFFPKIKAPDAKGLWQ